MKTILLPLILLAFIPVAAQRPQQPQRQILFDFRNERSNQPHKISAAAQRDVLSKVFRRYLNDANRCQANFDAGENFLAGARRAGQIVPNIAEVATGSFTAAGQNETAYLIYVNECNASHADNFGSKRIAIFSGPRLLADIDLDFKSSIVAKTDLDLDGINVLAAGDDHVLNPVVDEEIAVLVEIAGIRRLVVAGKLLKIGRTEALIGIP